MIDSIPSLMTIADCDLILAAMASERITTQYDRNQLELKNAAAILDGPTVERDIETTQLKIAGFEESLASTPEGPAKDFFRLEIQKLEVKLASLQKKEGNYDLQGLLEQQAEFQGLGGKLDALDVFIAAVNVRKAAL